MGTMKLHRTLNAELKQIKVGRDTLNRILKVNGMLVKPLRQYRKTTSSSHYLKKHKDLVTGIAITRPEQVWVSDITYIYNRNRYYYLSLITDAYSKKIMGYNVGNNLNAELTIKSLEMAIRQRDYKRKLIHHSDRGSQYCCNEYQQLLQKFGIRTSMTEKYDPYTNAIAERVNGILKQEFLLEGRDCSLAEMKVIVEHSIEVYNNKRLHISCSFLTPAKMHQQSTLKRKEYKSIKQVQKVI
jgi:putative transposase